MKPQVMNIDKFDKKILFELQKNAKISNLNLANKVGLSATPCARRVKTLEEQGVIEKAITILNPEKLGLNLIAYTAITMDKHTTESFDSFESQIIEFPEVVSASVVTGRAEDYLLRVIVRDMKHYEEFLLGRLNKIKGINTVHSSFELRSVIRNGILDI